MNIQKQLMNITCKEYCEKNNFKYIIIEEGKVNKVATPNYIDEKNENTKYVNVYHPEIYISELQDVNILGTSLIVFDNYDNCIFDTPSLDLNDRWDLKYCSTFYVDKYVTCIDYNDSFETIDEGIMLLAPTSANFYHFNLEILTKLSLINEFKEYNNTPILVDERILKIPSFQEELNFVNKTNKNIIYLKEAHSYKINKLIYISDLTITTPGFKPNVNAIYTDIIINPNSVKRLNKVLSKVGKRTKKIFISRDASPNSRLSNQSTVNDIFRGFGYEMICTELLSIEERINLFAEAEYIASPFGSGLTNILFANENVSIIGIQPKVYGESAFSCIADILNQNQYFIDAVPGCDKPYDYFKILHSRPTVDIVSLVRFLNELHNK